MKLSTLHNLFHYKVAKKFKGQWAIRVIDKESMKALKSYIMLLSDKSDVKNIIDGINSQIFQAANSIISEIGWSVQFRFFRKGSQIWLVIYDKNKKESIDEKYKKLRKIQSELLKAVNNIFQK